MNRNLKISQNQKHCLQIDSIQEDFVRLSGYASQLSDIESLNSWKPKDKKDQGYSTAI